MKLQAYSLTGDVAEPIPVERLGHVGLTDKEVSEVEAAYRSGATGSLLIGYRKGRRMMTTMLPWTGSEADVERRTDKGLDQMRRLMFDEALRVSAAE